jgi:Flp pilus assembly protein TadB
MTTNARQPSADSRINDRLARAVRQKKGPDVLLIGVLCAAIVLGLLGFALHVLWVVAIIVMALGLGFAVANTRRDRFDAEQLADDQAARAETRAHAARP